MAGAVNNLDAVRKKSSNGVEGLDGALRTAGQIEDERFAANGSDSARQDGARSVLKALAAHLFRHARNQPVGDRLRGFRRGVAWADSSATGSKDKIDPLLVGKLAEQGLNLCGFVGKNMCCADRPMELFATSGDGGAGSVSALAVGDSVADRDDGYVHPN